MEHDREKQLLKNQGFILIKEIFCQRLSKTQRAVITLKETEELLIQYLENATNGELPAILPENLKEAADYFDKHLETRENWEFINKKILKEYNYRERRNFILAHV